MSAASSSLLTQFLVLIALSVLLLGCGGEDGGNGEPQTGLPAVQDAPVELEEGERDPIASDEAVKGGEINMWGGPYPKTLNYWSDPNAFSGTVISLMFESLAGLHPTEDEPVGDLAESWEISADGMTFTFKIHPNARWSDGEPVTAEDVQFYYDTIMNPDHLTPVFRVGMSRLERPEVIDPKTIRITAKEQHWNNFWEAAGLYAFPKHEWEGKDFNQINFEFPVVSGPYEISEVKTNRSIMLKRRGDWWARVKPFNEGKFNFDYIRFRSIEDRVKALESLKKGDLDLYAIYTAQIWAEQTDFPQVQKGWVARQEIFNKEPIGFQGLAMNLRRPKFQDAKVREALAYLLNREQMNEKLMYDQYFLLNSFYPDLFENNQNPTAPFIPYDPKKARALLAEAGYTANDRGILEKDGRPLDITILHHGEDLRHLNIYLEDLKKVGIEARIERISYATWAKRVDEHDFDMIWMAWGAGRLRDPEAQWVSTEADRQGSNNISGVKDAKIDELIDLQKTEMDLAKRNEILKELDNRLTEIMPSVLLWQSDRTKLLYWRKFGMPRDPLGQFGRETSALAYWWVDPVKAKALAEAMANNTELPKPPDTIRFSGE